MSGPQLFAGMPGDHEEEAPTPKSDKMMETLRWKIFRLLADTNKAKAEQIGHGIARICEELGRPAEVSIREEPFLITLEFAAGGRVELTEADL